jgi:hypothetical protein
VQLVWLQDEEQVPRAGLPDEQRALVWLPVLVLGEQREPVWLRVLLPEERPGLVLLPDGSQVPRGGLRAWPDGPQGVPGGQQVSLPLPGDWPVLRPDDLLHSGPRVGPDEPLVEPDVPQDAPVVDLGELRVRPDELRGELRAGERRCLDEWQDYPPLADPDVLRRGVPSHAEPEFGH